MAEVRALVAAGYPADAARIIAELLEDLFQLKADAISFNRDIYSLNSLNGTFSVGPEQFFFKFHQEEREEAGAGEYYRVGLLAEAGMPVDRSLFASTEPGRQILVYRRRHDRRFADMLREIEFNGEADIPGDLLVAEAELNRVTMNVYRHSLHPIGPEQSAAEPIHRLFHGRLSDPVRPRALSGRFAAFYKDRDFIFPGLLLNWRELRNLRWRINGVLYGQPLGALFEAAFHRLEPKKLADHGGVVAHGDAHNANVWAETKDRHAHLVLFDPAFAGAHIPALLAEAKATFHNIFAHPLWLYDPSLADNRYQASAKLVPGELVVETNWRLSPLRRRLLVLKQESLWRPLLELLLARNLLPADWRQVLRLALFLCPTLVMNLRVDNLVPRSGAHNPVSSLIGLSVAVMMGSAPLSGQMESDKTDGLQRFLDAIDPHLDR